MSASTGIVMDDPSNIPGGIGGMVGIAGAAVVAGAVWLAKNLPKLGVERSADTAYKALIDDLRSQVTMERKRNDELRTSRDAAIAQIDALRQQVSDLSDQVAKLQRDIASMVRTP